MDTITLVSESETRENYSGDNAGYDHRTIFRKGSDQNLLATSLGTLVTPRQLGIIRALGRQIGCDVDCECRSLAGCGTDELSRVAAYLLIDQLLLELELAEEGEAAA